MNFSQEKKTVATHQCRKAIWVFPIVLLSSSNCSSGLHGLPLAHKMRVEIFRRMLNCQPN